MRKYNRFRHIELKLQFETIFENKYKSHINTLFVAITMSSNCFILNS